MKNGAISMTVPPATNICSVSVTVGLESVSIVPKTPIIIIPIPAVTARPPATWTSTLPTPRFR